MTRAIRRLWVSLGLVALAGCATSVEAPRDLAAPDATSGESRDEAAATASEAKPVVQPPDLCLESDLLILGELSNLRLQPDPDVVAAREAESEPTGESCGSYNAVLHVEESFAGKAAMPRLEVSGPLGEWCGTHLGMKGRRYLFWLSRTASGVYSADHVVEVFPTENGEFGIPQGEAELYGFDGIVDLAFEQWAAPIVEPGSLAPRALRRLVRLGALVREPGDDVYVWSRGAPVETAISQLRNHGCLPGLARAG